MDVVSYILAKNYTQKKIAEIGKPFVYKGTVDTYANLPVTNMKKGWVYTTSDTGSEYVWSSDSSSGTLDDYVEIGPKKYEEGTNITIGADNSINAPANVSAFINDADYATEAYADTKGQLNEALTTDVRVGRIPVGTSFPVGTSIESILRQMLIGVTPPTDEKWYVGVYTGMDRPDFNLLSGEELFANAQEKSLSASPYEFSPTATTQLIYLLIRQGGEIDVDNASYLTQGWPEPLLYTEDQIKGVAESGNWTVSGARGHSPITIEGNTYNVYGQRLATWNLTDVLTINLKYVAPSEENK